MGLSKKIHKATSDAKQIADKTIQWIEIFECAVIAASPLINSIYKAYVIEQQIKVLKTKEITLGLSWNERRRLSMLSE